MLLWQIEILCCECATSNPRNYLSLPKSLILKDKSNTVYMRLNSNDFQQVSQQERSEIIISSVIE